MKVVPHVPEGDNAERRSPTSFHDHDDDEDIVDISEQSHLATNRKGSTQALGNVSGVITNVHDPKTSKHPTPATAPPTPLAPEVNISSSSLRRPLDPPEVIIWLYICLAQNKNVPTCQPDVKLPLCNLTKRDVADIASGLHYNLTHEVNEEEAVETFLHCYPSMQELNLAYGDFMNSLIVVSSEILSDQQKWAKVKLFASAGLSLCDMITDVFMVVEYFVRKEDKYAWAILGCIIFNLTSQSILTFLQHRKNNRRRQLKEQVYVWTLMKPGVNAWRVASRSQKEKGAVVSAIELAMCKGLELVVESIPGTLIQLMAIMRSGWAETSKMAYFSFFSCILTSAFTSAIMSWDWDSSKVQRRFVPWFYGYIPSNSFGKVAVFTSLFTLSSFNLLTRAFACLLFYLKGGVQQVAIFLGGEFLLFLIVKVLQGDLWHWLPIYGIPGACISFFFRLMAKLLSDWTAVAQSRHPSDVGGAYFSFNLGLTVATGAFAALSYNVGDGEGGMEGSLSENSVLIFMAFVCLGTVVSYALLLLSMKKEYRYTFFSVKTGKQYTQEIFTMNSDSERKFKILSKNTHLWKKTIGVQVKSWIGEKLPVWIEEQPEWFNDEKMSLITDDMVEDPAMLVRLRTKNVQGILDQRRRSSVVEDMLQALNSDEGGNK
ncbi:hypothetical protein TrCOL_g5094 [Triparma columacea]|uniref:Uncharacterized protein n=1 Tax=Triparma columacea TaxID=722753 RepID=A0A9W7GBK6_9STRA|nr:hypothetical protein TrCOL_g5094 [Triparma columacea]